MEVVSRRRDAPYLVPGQCLEKSSIQKIRDYDFGVQFSLNLTNHIKEFWGGKSSSKQLLQRRAEVGGIPVLPSWVNDSPAAAVLVQNFFFFFFWPVYILQGWPDI